MVQLNIHSQVQASNIYEIGAPPGCNQRAIIGSMSGLLKADTAGAIYECTT